MEMSGASRSGLTIKLTGSTGALAAAGTAQCRPQGVGGVAALTFRKLPWFRSGLQWKDKNGPAPRHPPLILGRVRSFARHGMSAVCLAIYKGREVGIISL
jgi:hypothetical protein